MELSACDLTEVPGTDDLLELLVNSLPLADVPGAVLVELLPELLLELELDPDELEFEDPLEEEELVNPEADAEPELFLEVAEVEEPLLPLLLPELILPEELEAFGCNLFVSLGSAFDFGDDLSETIEVSVRLQRIFADPSFDTTQLSQHICDFCGQSLLSRRTYQAHRQQTKNLRLKFSYTYITLFFISGIEMIRSSYVSTLCTYM